MKLETLITFLSIPIGFVFWISTVVCFVSLIKLIFGSKAMRKERLREFLNSILAILLFGVLFVGMSAIYAYAPRSIVEMRLDIKHFIGFLVAIVIVRFIVKQISDGIKKLEERKRYE